MMFQKVWLDPFIQIIHGMDSIIPFTFTACGVGSSTGLRMVYETEGPRTVSCLECLCLTNTQNKTTS